jgi:hypothetical protein
MEGGKRKTEAVKKKGRITKVKNHEANEGWARWNTWEILQDVNLMTPG